MSFVKADAESLVDVTAPARLSMEEFPVKLKMPCDLAKVVSF
jgi:hypothetical protein